MPGALSEVTSPTSKPKWWRPFSKGPSSLDPYTASIPFGNGNKSPPYHHQQFPNPNHNHHNHNHMHPHSKHHPAAPTVFGAKLEDSSRLASVAISMIGADKKAYIYGYIPVIVAKCGLFLKENATTTEGVFRISGSTKRMRELQAVFDDPPGYGKHLDWKTEVPDGTSPVPVIGGHGVGEGQGQVDGEVKIGKPYYSVHDAANVLRRYLMSLPEPLIPYTMYKDFRSVLTKHTSDVPKQVLLFRALISTLPSRSQYLLLYLLDLLAVFARKSSINLMTASNLAVVFQPGLCSPPPRPKPKVGQPPPDLAQQESLLREVRDAQQVLEFLIDHQNSFVMGLSPTAPATTSSAASASSAAIGGGPHVTPKHVRVATPTSLSSDDDGLHPVERQICPVELVNEANILGDGN